MKHAINLALQTLLISLVAANTAVAGSTGTHLPEQPKWTPAELAVVRYESGSKHRDKAMVLEQQIRNTTDKRKAAKLQRKLNKESKKAIADFENVIELSPRHYRAYSSLGFTLAMVGRHQESLAAYDQSLKINPTFDDAIWHRGEMFLQLNRIEDAKRAYLSLTQDKSPLAGQLLSAMTTWISTRRQNPAGLDQATIDQFAEWIDQNNHS